VIAPTTTGNSPPPPRNRRHVPAAPHRHPLHAVPPPGAAPAPLELARALPHLVPHARLLARPTSPATLIYQQYDHLVANTVAARACGLIRIPGMTGRCDHHRLAERTASWIRSRRRCLEPPERRMHRRALRRQRLPEFPTPRSEYGSLASDRRMSEALERSVRSSPQRVALQREPERASTHPGRRISASRTPPGASAALPAALLISSRASHDWTPAKGGLRSVPGCPDLAPNRAGPAMPRSPTPAGALATMSPPHRSPSLICAAAASVYVTSRPRADEPCSANRAASSSRAP